MKPKYKIPSMREIEAIKPNGYNVVSTFSGGGGSCLGYRMAGFNVLYANEFVAEAQKTYKANHKAYLDTRDIRQVTPESILEITGLKKGEIDLFDGSPPCCAFSVAGKCEKHWNDERAYSDGKVQKIEDLFFEYTRLLRGLQPKTFVAENVKGLILGKAKGYFKLILKEMQDCGYEVRAAVLNAKWLGVPQSRERIIFVGVRKDLVKKYNVHPIHPSPLKYMYSLREAFDGVQNNEQERQLLLEYGNKFAWGNILKQLPKNPKRPLNGMKVTGGSYFNLRRESLNYPCGTICQMNGKSNASGNCHPLEDRKFTIAELRRITSIPDDFILTGSFEQQWERLGRMVPPIMMAHIAETIRSEILDKCKE